MTIIVNYKIKGIGPITTPRPPLYPLSPAELIITIVFLVRKRY